MNPLNAASRSVAHEVCTISSLSHRYLCAIVGSCAARHIPTLRRWLNWFIGFVRLPTLCTKTIVMQWRSLLCRLVTWASAWFMTFMTLTSENIAKLVLLGCYGMMHPAEHCEIGITRISRCCPSCLLVLDYLRANHFTCVPPRTLRIQYNSTLHNQPSLEFLESVISIDVSRTKRGLLQNTSIT